MRVLRGAAPADVVRTTIEHAFERHSAAPRADDVFTIATAEELHEMMAALAEKARHVARTPGVAVYLRAPGTTQFRASVTWTSDSPIPHSPYHMPRVFGWILETGEALVLPDLATQPLTDVPTSTLQDVVRGLIAVPITGPNGQIAGTICVFDLKPLALSDLDVDALKALGRSVSFGELMRDPSEEDAVDTTPPPLMPPMTAHPQEPPFQEPPPAAYAHSRVEAASTPASYPFETASAKAAADSTTPLLNRLNGEFAAARELARARREQRQVSVVLFSVSPPHGGQGATAVARAPAAMVGETLVKAIRESDVPIRWSGDEVLLVLPGLGLDDARRVAERVRAALQAGTGHRASVSAGVAELVASETFTTLVTRARERVRLALEHGHNRVA